MKKILVVVIVLELLFLVFQQQGDQERNITSSEPQKVYWFLLHRKSNVEFLYHGIQGEKEKSKLIKKFQVKTGIPGERPTPLPKLLGKEYWMITQKHEEKENLETAPYFLTLNIPVTEEEPFGPSPYRECFWSDSAMPDGQCHWQLPGAFGLHGVNGDLTRLLQENPGSSGCIRHTDEDITYLYNLLDVQKEPVRYYIEDI